VLEGFARKIDFTRRLRVGDFWWVMKKELVVIGEEEKGWKGL
jgi:hypothetical protein